MNMGAVEFLLPFGFGFGFGFFPARDHWGVDENEN
jgi:hypothetical protein